MAEYVIEFLLTTLVLTIVYMVMKLAEKHQYWQHKGIPHLKALPILGNALPVIRTKSSLHELYKDIYFKFPNEKVVGIYELYKPVLLIRDPELIEKILVKDFQHFTDHPQISEDGGIFTNGLFQLKGNIWRKVRHKISHVFTTLKMKEMFSVMVDCSDQLVEDIKGNVNTDYEIHESISAYAINVIANSAFGIEIQDKETLDEFIKYSNTIFEASGIRFINSIMLALFPRVSSGLGLKFIPKNTSKYFSDLIIDVVNRREKSQYQRNDLIQILVKIKQQIQQSEDAESNQINTANDINKVDITEDILVGQAFQFLSAGFDPQVNGLQFVMFDLAVNPEIQKCARRHVVEVLSKHSNQFTYECLEDMTYLDQCLHESLRLHTLPLSLFRECTKPYYLAEKDLEIQKGQKIVISLIGMHMDPKYYPEPEKFDPERFAPNGSKNNCTYIPFGDGPRICIGMKYAMLVIKLGLAKILSKFKFSLSSKTKLPLTLNTRAILMLPEEKLLFNISEW